MRYKTKKNQSEFHARILASGVHNLSEARWKLEGVPGEDYRLFSLTIPAKIINLTRTMIMKVASVYGDVIQAELAPRFLTLTPEEQTQQFVSYFTSIQFLPNIMHQILKSEHITFTGTPALFDIQARPGIGVTYRLKLRQREQTNKIEQLIKKLRGNLPDHISQALLSLKRNNFFDTRRLIEHDGSQTTKSQNVIAAEGDWVEFQSEFYPHGKIENAFSIGSRYWFKVTENHPFIGKQADDFIEFPVWPVATEKMLFAAYKKKREFFYRARINRVAPAGYQMSRTGDFISQVTTELFDRLDLFYTQTESVHELHMASAYILAHIRKNLRISAFPETIELLDRKLKPYILEHDRFKKYHGVGKFQKLFSQFCENIEAENILLDIIADHFGIEHQDDLIPANINTNPITYQVLVPDGELGLIMHVQNCTFGHYIKREKALLKLLSALVS